MIQDPKLREAVAKIVQRSERQEDVQRLVGTYVDVGLLPQLDNTNHQILYGRRGTGKTHVLKVLASRLVATDTNAVTYIDCRVLGSTSQFSDTELPIGMRCLSLFRDVLLAIYQDLLEHIVEKPSARAEEALVEAGFLQSLITEPLQTVTKERVTSEETASHEASAGLNVTGGATPQATLSAAAAAKGSQRTAAEYAVRTEDKVVFPELHRTLTRVLNLADCRLFVLIDEWSSLPRDVQPYLAEFLKRGLLPNPRAILKIAALEHRSHFSLVADDRIVGFELGADVATGLDLDDYFVFDRNPDRITDIYADVLLRHISTELPDGYLRDEYGISSGAQLASRLFTERATCAELARAAEGVIRDLINVFTQSYFHADRRSRESIDRMAVRESARQWFEQDKAQYLDSELQELLRRIVDEVIGQKRARSFLLPRSLEKHPLVQKLFDARVLHLMRRGYADKSNPGLRYNIYTIDYGAYVDLINTSKQPVLDLLDEPPPDDDKNVVPFDDKRSIRRIVLSEDIVDVERRA